MTMSLDPATTGSLLHRLAALGASTQPQPTAAAMGPQPTAQALAWQEMSRRSPVLDRMDALAEWCAGYASAAAVRTQSSMLAADLEALHTELRQVTAAAIDRARSLGIIDLTSAQQLSALADSGICAAASTCPGAA